MPVDSVAEITIEHFQSLTSHDKPSSQLGKVGNLRPEKLLASLKNVLRTFSAPPSRHTTLVISTPAEHQVTLELLPCTGPEEPPKKEWVLYAVIS
jgi:hypothetical protein